MPRSAAPVPEIVYRVLLNGRVAASLNASPDAGPELAAGWLLAGGYVDPADVPPELAWLEDDHGAAVSLAPLVVAGVADLEAHRRDRGCGLRHFTDCDPGLLAGRAGDAPTPSADRVAALLRALFERSTRYRDGGGVHTAAAVRDGELEHVVEDVSRHCAVDRVLGAALLAGKDLRRLGLVTTARISGEIAHKAARAGVAWVASRSVPTSLAVDIAAIAGTALIARAAGPEPRLFRGGVGRRLDDPTGAGVG